jgi:hypothetical protein
LDPKALKGAVAEGTRILDGFWKRESTERKANGVSMGL